MLELIVSYFLTKLNIITKKPNNPDCHLNHSVSMAKQNNKDAGDFLKKITSEHIASAFTKKHELFQHEKFKSQHFFIIS